MLSFLSNKITLVLAVVASMLFLSLIASGVYIKIQNNKIIALKINVSTQAAIIEEEKKVVDTVKRAIEQYDAEDKEISKIIEKELISTLDAYISNNERIQKVKFQRINKELELCINELENDNITYENNITEQYKKSFFTIFIDWIN